MCNIFAAVRNSVRIDVPTPLSQRQPTATHASIHLGASHRERATGFVMQESTDPDLMRYWHDAPKRRGDVVTIPILWLTLILSLLVHLAALWEVLPKLPLLHGEPKELPSIAEERLAVQLMPRVQPQSTPSSPPPPAQGTPTAPAGPASPLQPKPRAPKSPAAPSSPPVVATAPPTQNRPALPPPTPERAPLPAAPAPPSQSISPPQVGQDLASYIAARRAARGEPEPSPSQSTSQMPVENDAERRNRIIAANLASINTPTFGTDPRKSGGIFTLRSMSDNDAEFTFYGWNKDINRRTAQKIEVRKGNNSDIRIAVVRRIIEVIRYYEHEDFNWSSQRLGRVVVLSARPGDNAGLEDFMMEEFFSVQRR
jgi:hypothetical protein